jgi:taurine dioxygenase
MAVTLDPLHPALGAEVHGLDLSHPIDEPTAATLRAAFDQFGLLLVRQSDLEVDDHGRFVQIFGPVREPHGYISNVEANGYQPEWPLLFHSDFLFGRAPLEGLSLYALEIGDGCVPTRFASTAYGARTLPADLRGELEHLRVVHMADLTPAAREDVRQREEDFGGPDASRQVYPRSIRDVLTPHPRTDVELLSVAEQQASHFEGMSYADSDALLERIFTHLHGDPSTVYEHYWQVGDLLVWDNLMLVHARRAAPTTVRRSLRRVTITPYTVAELLGGLQFDERPDANVKVDQ